MEANLLIGGVALVVAAVAAAVLIQQVFMKGPQTDLRALMRSGVEDEVRAEEEELKKPGLASAADIEKLKKEARKRQKKQKQLTIEERYFQAGIFSDRDKEKFQRIRMMGPFIGAGFMGILVWYLTGPDLALIGAILGVLLGLQAPISILERKTKARNEEIMFFLPLVIEQIAIGVSSSLDVGPCLQKVVQMADERDTHNVVTELIRIAQFYVKSGASLEEAMTEVGRLSGHTELKHAFMSLSQVAKHGGEITRQLQELADAVSMQRETRIEERIKKLELEATAPVALVFVGFMIILLVGFGLQIQGAF